MADDDFVWLDSSSMHSMDNSFFVNASNLDSTGVGRTGIIKRSLQPKLAVSDETLQHASTAYAKEQQEQADRLGTNSACRRSASLGTDTVDEQAHSTDSQPDILHSSPAKHTESTTDKLAKKSWLFVLLYTCMMVGFHTAGYYLLVVDSK